MSRRKVLFYVHHLYYLPQFLPVARALTDEDGFEVWFTAPRSGNALDYKLIESVIRTTDWQFLSARNEKERRQAILKRNFAVTVFGKSSHIEKLCTPDTLAVLLYHGIGFKACYYTDYNPRFDVRYVESDYRQTELQRRGIPTPTVVTGFPKLDLLFDRSLKEEYENKLRLVEAKPTVLYAPTFYPSSIEVFGEQVARQTADCNLIIKLHHFAWLMPKYRHQARLCRSLAENYAHVRIAEVNDYNIIPFFQLSDLLLTEASSTAIEYLATGQPVILADFVKLRWKHRLFRRRFENQRMDNVIRQELDFAWHCTQPGDLKSVIHQALTRRESMRPLELEKRQRLLGVVDGSAAHRVAADLKARLNHR